MALDDYNCVLCSSGCEETSFHLFFECPFSQVCWNSIPMSWDTNLQPLDMIIKARSDFGNAFFREILITVCWAIWITRNGVIFYHEHATIHIWKKKVQR
jgi:hypothetical protein